MVAVELRIAFTVGVSSTSGFIVLRHRVSPYPPSNDELDRAGREEASVSEPSGRAGDDEDRLILRLLFPPGWWKTRAEGSRGSVHIEP